MLGSFVVATTLISLMPGPSMLIIMMTAIERGWRQAMRTILGAVLADALLLVVVLSGLGALLYASALAFTALKWLGVGYLIYLGVMQLRGPAEVIAGASPSIASGNAFWQGLGTTLLNPKIIGFLIVYFPQFLDRKAPLLQQMAVLGPLFLLIVFLVFVLCAFGAQALRSVLATPRGRVWVKHATGVSLIGCGVASMAA